jgi:hypothetical protein
MKDEKQEDKKQEEKERVVGAAGWRTGGGREIGG